MTQALQGLHGGEDRQMAPTREVGTLWIGGPLSWIDTDVYCHKPMTYESDYVFGYELPGEHRVNNAVLGMPADSEILRQMIEFTDDRYSIAPFLPRKRQGRCAKWQQKENLFTSPSSHGGCGVR